jgi:hypothetical protein
MLIDYEIKKDTVFNQGVFTNWPGFKMMQTKCSHFLGQTIAWQITITLYVQNNLPTMKIN